MDATLEPRLVVSDKLAGDFYIPAYQRGYRWGRPEVTRLLDDIKSSVVDATSPRNYYLQPVVVLRSDDGRWELVDGQQRMTTLYLIIRYIRVEALPKAKVHYTLSYETRDNSHQYLEDLDPSRRSENIDFHHIYGAYEAISEWFEAQDNPLQAAIDVHTALSKQVYVIWYEAAKGTNPTELFTRLNVGRIPLTDAELIKALVLSKSGAISGQTDRQDQIAAQWDSFERDLRDPELWAFLTASSEGRPTHIDVIFETLAGEPEDAFRPRFWTFEKLRERIEDPTKADAARDFWDSVVSMHGLLTGWFEDRELYHRIGYLIATGDSFAEILNVARGLNRGVFRDALVDRIRKRLRRTRSDIRELTYERDLRVCQNVLLLMNVETVLRHDEADRFSFHAFASGQWSVEHIHAQNAEGLNRVEQWSTWLELHRRAIATLPGRLEDANAALFSRIDEVLVKIDADKFRLLEREILAIFADHTNGEMGDDVHRLSNLALLTRGINSALSNSVFEVKRQEILHRDKNGAYIPPCTRNVFLKYYTDAADQQLHIWGPQDRAAYFDAMVEFIGPYLLPDPEEAVA